MTNPTRPTAATPGSGERTSTYPLEQLLLLWRRGDLTETQMVGHLLQHAMSHDKRIHYLEQYRGASLAEEAALYLKGYEKILTASSAPGRTIHEVQSLLPTRSASQPSDLEYRVRES